MAKVIGRGNAWLCGVAIAGLVACGEDEQKGTVEVDSSDEIEVFVPEEIIDFDTALQDSSVDPDAEVGDATEEIDTAPPEPGEFGYACDENLDCNSGWCIQTANGRQCTRTCLDQCPKDFDCREAPGMDATYICLPRFLNLCDPCRETADCNQEGESGNYCLRHGADGRFCGVACEEDADCPTAGAIDYVCRNVPVGGGAEAKQCVPAEGMECSCSPLATQLQKATVCEASNDNGTCEGTRFCLMSGLSTCDAQPPLPESCNKLDDNCNGVTDDFPPDYVCEITNEFGSCPGAGTCVDGVETCIGTEPAPDICDLVDNDCDGETDEGLCDDLNPCTKDLCDPNDGRCVHQNDNTQLCDDGNVCTQLDKCQDGACVGFNPKACDDGNTCTTETCDPTVGCLSSFNTAPCEDGNPCTVNDACNQGVCVSGGPNSCDDGNACTDDSCQAGVGCVNNADDSNTCNINGLSQCKRTRCQAAQCIAINNDGVGCTTGSSDCPAGTCNGGQCRVNLPQSCNYDPDICEGDVPGACASDGSCSPSANPSCVCSGGCAGICVCCQLGPIPLQLCIPF